MRYLFHLVISLCILALSSCKNSVAPQLMGAWQIDSVFDYYNGFTYTNKNPSPKEVHVYQEDHTMLRKGMGEQKTYYFELNGQHLTIRDLPQATVGNELEIAELTPQRLVLRKNKRPQFEGKNQQRYELQYFSRLP